MPKFSPLCFNLPVNPSIQVMRSLDSYNDVELKKFQINKKHFSNIIYPQNKKINSPFIVRENWEKFIQNKWYLKKYKPSIYYYKISNPTKQIVGFIGSLSTHDFFNNNVTMHEQTYSKRVQHMTNYIKTVKIQAEPVIVIHESPLPVTLILNKIENKKCSVDFEFENTKHQLWRLNETQNEILNTWSQKQNYFHLADGHHRSECMINLSKDIKADLPISTFLVHQNQISLDSFVWFSKNNIDNSIQLKLVDRLIELGAIKFLNKSESVIDFSLIVKINNSFYGLMIQESKDETIPHYINNFILKGFNEIQNTLEYRPNLSHLKISKTTLSESLAFYMKPISKQSLFDNAKNKIFLPAKSTYISPKMLTGMVVSSLVNI
ncbi:MAG: DUF1015 family protein [Flavobacteriales bacterium]